MTDLFLSVKWEGDDLLQAVRLTEKRLRWVAAKTMTGCAKHAQGRIRAKTPQFIDSPTRWTMNSTFVKMARPTDPELFAMVGFRDYAVKGTPAADYLQPIAAGHRRAAKPHEKLLRLRGIIAPNQYLVPTGNSPFSFNQYGNITPGRYVQLLSRFKALRDAGSGGNANQSYQSKRKRKSLSLYKAGKTIQARTGNNKTQPIFYITNKQPKYKQSFPVRRIMTEAVADVFSSEFKKQVEAELNYKPR